MREHFSRWATFLVGAVIGFAACRSPRSPEAPDLADARALVLAAQLALPAARQACPATPDPAACSGVADALDDLLAVVGPQLEACQETEGREACEAERLDELRKRLPELRRLVLAVAKLARGAS